jgi:hypothetical protein
MVNENRNPLCTPRTAERENNFRNLTKKRIYFSIQCYVLATVVTMSSIL